MLQTKIKSGSQSKSFGKILDIGEVFEVRKGC